MPDKAAVNDATPAEEGAAQPAAAPATPPKRSPGHRGQDVRDTMAEMAARAHEISLEAGSKMAGALKDVINAARGLFRDEPWRGCERATWPSRYLIIACTPFREPAGCK